MVKVVRCPAVARSYFTPHELSGWPEGIPQYVSRRRRTRSELRRIRDEQLAEYAASLSRPPIVKRTIVGVAAE